MPYPCLAQVGEQHFDFDHQATEQLEYKHLFAALIQAGDIDAMPKTYLLDESNWTEVLKQITVNEPDYRWILKPSLLNNGQHIHLFDNLQQLAIHYASPHRLGGPHVLQRYIENPHLLRGHKYSIRVFVVLTNQFGGFLFPDGYLNVARYPYQAGFHDQRVHLTNEHLKQNEVNTIQIPTSRLRVFAEFYLPIKAIITRLLGRLMQTYAAVFHPKQSPRLAIFGFDFIADANHTLWLLEANHGPCFPISTEHPLQSYLYDRFWQNVISQFIAPIAQQKPNFVSGDFEQLY